MDQGEEAGTESLKEDRLDFALWKARKPDEDTAWPSPWSEGRPGWHIECSAMAEKLLGGEFAIHGGGVDLVFPHHENEIAQTEAARGRPLARLWMHNGMVRIAEEKMSKSLGNIFQLSEALDRFGRDAVVTYLISGHYRQPLEFSARALEEVFELVAEGNRRPLPGARAALEKMLPLLGLETMLAPAGAIDPEAGRLMSDRERARAEGDFERADRIRDELGSRGYEVRDTPD